MQDARQKYTKALKETLLTQSQFLREREWNTLKKRITHIAMFSYVLRIKMTGHPRQTRVYRIQKAEEK